MIPENKTLTTEKLPQHVRVPHGMCNNNLDYQVVGLYAFLRKYMNNTTHSTFVTIKTLNKDTGLSTATIQKYLNILEEKGHIKIIRGKGNKKPNVYVFNPDSELYNKGFEMYTFEFMKDEKISFKEKCALIVFQEKMMGKDSGTGRISSTALNMSNCLNTSYPTYKKIEKNLIENGWMSIADTRAKDSASGVMKNLYMFDLEVLGQAILYNQKKIKEHDEAIGELSTQNTEQDRRIQELENKVKELSHTLNVVARELNAKNKEELESNNISIKVV